MPTRWAGKPASTWTDLDEIANSPPVRKLINMVLLMAIRDHASDIHFEPFEDEYKMRYRCDGVLYEMVPPPRHLAMAISSRIKVMSNLDIAERRLPQDGRIELNVGGNQVDMRVSILPTMFGESVVIRVLDRIDRRPRPRKDRHAAGHSGHVPPADQQAQRHRARHRPDRLPARRPRSIPPSTNSTTSTDKLITTEDPVEYEIDGIVQCPINDEIDLTFAAALRAILRQDPGHDPDRRNPRPRNRPDRHSGVADRPHGLLAPCTPTMPRAPITRLRDMGVEPFLITATVEGIQAQRLVRQVCQNCRAGYDPTATRSDGTEPHARRGRGKKFFYGEGCDKCNNLGFKGRTGLYEVLDDERRPAGHDQPGVSTDAAPQLLPQAGQCEPSGSRPARPVRRHHHPRRSRARNGAGR